MLVARAVRYLFRGRVAATGNASGRPRLGLAFRDYGSLQDQVGRSRVRRVSDECQDPGRERVRRVGHHPEGTSWSDEFLQIALDD
jgi:hypothetical protein